MPRAPKACPRSGCPKAITVRGRCEDHQFPVWERTWARPEMDRKWYRDMRKRVLSRDQYRCVVCGAPANETDHIIAKCFGGADHEDNMATLCTTHHKQKTAKEAVLARRLARQRRQT